MPMPTSRLPADIPGTEEFQRAVAADEARRQRQLLPLGQQSTEDLRDSFARAKAHSNQMHAATNVYPGALRAANARVTELWQELSRRAGGGR